VRAHALRGWIQVMMGGVMVAGCVADDETIADDLADEDVASEEAALATDPTAAVDAPRTPGPHSILFEQQADIAAPASRVFDAMIDVDAYADWNPWLIEAEGDVVPGGTVTVQVVMNGKAQKATHEVLIVEPDTHFCWKDSGWNSWFVYAQRCRWLTAAPGGGTHYRVQLMFDGPLSGLAKLLYGAATEAGLAAETQALETYAERP
jgi:uncharacterized protein YndB with AHSA1/START domain